MLAQLISFELNYHRKQILFWVGLVIMTLMGIIMSNSLQSIYMNSPYKINFASTLFSLFSIFVITVFSSTAILRDFDNKMSEIIFASPLEKLNYLLSRFLGLVITTTCVMIMGIFGMFLASLFAPETAGIGPIVPEFYLFGLVIIIIPNVLLNSALIFSTALFSRSAITTYISGMLLYMLYIVGSMVGNSPLMAQATPVSPDNAALAALLEPYGLIGFFEQTRYWTLFEKNTQQVVLEGAFMFNRLLWTGLSFMIFAGTYRLFAFRSLKVKRIKAVEASAFIGEILPYKAVLPEIHDKLIDLQVLFSKIKIEYLSVIKGIPFIVISLAMLFIVGMEVSQQLGRGIYTVPFYPSTGLIVPNIQEVLAKVGFFIVLFYSAELYWNERSVKINELIDTSPTKNSTFYIGKLIVLIAIISTLILLAIIASIGYQIYRGFYEFRLDLYLSLFRYAGYGLLLDAILALFLQNFVKNKYVGMGFSFLVFAYATILAMAGVSMHQLSSYGNLPEFLFSDMANIVFFQASHAWYLLYWTGIAIALMGVSLLLWKRGYVSGIKQLKLKNYYAPVLGLVIAIYSGSYIYYNSNIKIEQLTETEHFDQAEAYEEKYKQYENLNQPTISAVNLKVDLYPEDRRYDVNGYYILTNKSNQSIERIMVGIRKQDVLTAKITIDEATIESYDQIYQIYWFKPNQPLASGDSLKMTIAVRVDQSDFTDADTENYIIENGSYIEISKYLAYVGYSSFYEISDRRERRKRGLSPRQTFADVEDKNYQNEDHINLDLQISTAADQTPITVGYIVKEWLENGRRYVHYKQDKKVMNWYAISSARYAVQKVTHNGIEILFYYHPQHEENVPTMIESAKASLDYYSEQFGPYQYKQLKYAEVPNFSRSFGATSYPNTIYAVEFRGFHMDQSNPDNLNVAYLQVSHEIAHQWWADQLEPAQVAGYRFLTESLAEYSEMAVYEKKYGMKGVKQYLAEMTDIYLSSRGFSGSDETPLYKSQDQSHVNYQKGALAMHALKGLIGEENVNLALKRFLQANPYPKNPVSYNLLDEFYAVSDSTDHPYIDNLLKGVYTYDLGIDSIYSKQIGKELELDIKLRTLRLSRDSVGNTITHLPDEAIQIAVYDGHPDLNSSKLLYLQKHKMISNNPRFTIKASSDAKYLVIDPNYYMIEKDRFNNIYKLNQSKTN